MPGMENDCCDMRGKVGLGIAKIYSEEECGVSDSAMLDYHDFSYTSPSQLPVAAALTFRFCPWCGTARTVEEPRRTIEVIRGRVEGT